MSPLTSTASRLGRFGLASCLLLGLFTANLVQAQDTPPVAPPAEPAPPPAAAEDLPSANEIIHASREAMGGKAAVDDINSFKIEAKLNGPMGEVEFNLQSKETGAFHLVQQMTDIPAGTVVYNGDIAWTVSGESQYELVDAMVLEQGRAEFNILFPYWFVFNPHDHFKTLRTVERTQFNGRECYKVEMSDERRPRAAEAAPVMQRHAFYDVEEKLVRGMQVTQETPFGAMSVDFVYGDWKKIDEVNVFTSVTIEQLGHQVRLEYSKVEFNTVDPAVFEVPAQVKELVERAKEEQDATPPPPPSPPTEPTPNGDPDD